MDLIPWHRD